MPIEKMSITEIDQSNKEAWDMSRIDTLSALNLAEKLKSASVDSDYEKGLAESLRTIGQCHWLMGVYTQAIEHLEPALGLFKKLNLLSGEAEVSVIYGAVSSKMGNLDKAINYYEYSLNICKELEDTEGIVKSMNSIGDSYMQLGNYEQALIIFHKILELKHDNKMFLGIVKYNIAEVYFHLGQTEKSLIYIAECEQLGEELDFELMKIYCSTLSGKIEIKKGKLAEGIQYLKVALRHARMSQYDERTYFILEDLSDAFEKLGDHESALIYFKEFHTLKATVLNSESLKKLKTWEQKLETERLKKETELEREKNIELKAAYSEIEQSRNKITIQNKEINQSIRYAQRIQNAILPSDEMIKNLFPQSFVLNLPKDVLSGDFYWVSEVTTNYKEKFLLAAVADCTGHGVPGALMSLIGNNYLRQCETENEVNTPAEALDFINKGLSKTLRQDARDTVIQDGMDISFIAIDYHAMKLYFASAKRTILVVRNGEVTKYTGDSNPVGAYISDSERHFTNHTVAIQKGDIIYQFTDGYIDQFGGAKGKKFMIRRFVELIQDISPKPMDAQLTILKDRFSDWKGSLEQIDDVCVMGIRV